MGSPGRVAPDRGESSAEALGRVLAAQGKTSRRPRGMQRVHGAASRAAGGILLHVAEDVARRLGERRDVLAEFEGEGHWTRESGCKEKTNFRSPAVGGASTCRCRRNPSKDRVSTGRGRTRPGGGDLQGPPATCPSFLLLLGRHVAMVWGPVSLPR